MKKPVRAALPIFKNPSNENMEFLEQKKPILDQVQWRLIIMQITWGPGRNKVIISIYSIRVFFLKKGNLLWFSWFLHYLNSPSQTWSLGRSKMTFNLSCVFLKLLKYSKIEKKCYFWLQALAHAVLGIGLLAWLGNVSHRLTRIDKIVASWLTKIKSYTQKYSRLRCLLRVKGLVICFYLGWSVSILQFRQNIIKVDSKSWLLTCSSNITLSLPSYNGSALKRELNFCNGYLNLLYFC